MGQCEYFTFCYQVILLIEDASNLPLTNTSEDAEAVERDVDFGLGLYATPVFLTGDWPATVSDTLSPEILPRFTDAEKALIKGMSREPDFSYVNYQLWTGSADFFAIDSYTNFYVAAPPNGIESCTSNMSDPNWPSCAIEVQYDLNGWSAGYNADPGSSWLQVTPKTLSIYLKEIYKRWPSKEIVQSANTCVAHYTDLFVT